MPRYIVAVQDTPPWVCVTDDVEGLSPEVWAIYEGTPVPIERVTADDPLSAANIYLAQVGLSPSDIPRLAVNLLDGWDDYHWTGGEWEVLDDGV